MNVLLIVIGYLCLKQLLPVSYLCYKGYIFGGLIEFSCCSIPGKRRREKWRQRLPHGVKKLQKREHEMR